MKRQDCIIVLHYTRISDSAVMLHSVSRTYGRKSFLVKGAGKYICYFQPLNILDCDLSSSTKSTLLSAGAFYEAVPLPGIRNSYHRNAICMFLAEVLYRTLEEDMADEDLFDWCVAQIRLLEDLNSDYANFHPRFLLEYCARLGYAPEMGDLLPFLGEHANLVRGLLEASPDKAMLLPMSGRERSAICGELLQYLSFHLDRSVGVKSLEVMRELF